MNVTRGTFAAVVMALWILALLPGQARADEAAVRSASKALVDDWNRHDVKAWTAHLAEDAWYTETNDSVYQRNKGREQAVNRFSYSDREQRPASGRSCA